jgi:TonB family protein
MASPGIEIVVPAPSTYGAVELKEVISKHTIKGHIITVGIFILLLLLYIGVAKFTEMKTNKMLIAPISKVKLIDLQPLSNADEPPPPPTDQIINTGPASRAGTPVPVPETQIPADLKEFASMDELSRASSEGGNGVDNGGFASNIDLNKEKVEIKQREEEPDAYEFIAVEKEPYIDLAELQKKIEYPEMAKRANVEGKVTIRVLVGKDGKPIKTLIEQSDNELLNDAARKAVLKSIFTPAIQNGHAITCWVSIPISFRLR